MNAPKAPRTIFLTFILILGSLLPALTSSPALATTPSSQTTLYFTDTLNSIINENYSDLGFASMSQTIPTKQNDSQYPPSIFIKNTTRLIPRFNLNTEPLLTWMSSWLLEFLDGSPDLNFSDFSGIFGDLDLLFPNPYRIVEGYTYNGNDTLTIKGDLFYNLYFTSPVTKPKFRDDVKVGVYWYNIESLPPIKEIKNTTVTLTPGRFSDVYNQQITLTDISYTLKPGDSLLFSIEIIPSNKTLPSLITKYIDINRFLTRWEQRANRWENRSNIKILQNMGTNLKEVISIMNASLMNITSEDFAAVINAMRSTSIVYDSAKHPASVSIPAKISEEDIRIYYLHVDQTMDEKRPSTGNQSGSSKITQTPIVWISPDLERNKILNIRDVVANLYLDHRDLLRLINILRGKITIIATLYDDNTSIASSEKQLSRTSILHILIKPTAPLTFSFNSTDREITYGHSIRLEVSVKNGTKLGLRTVKLLYDTARYPSALRVKFQETQNIEITGITSDPLNGKIIPGGTVQYTLNITSKNADTLQISTIERAKFGDWEIIVPESTTVSADSMTSLMVTVKSKNDLKEAYGNTINQIIEVLGNTGISRREISAEVSSDSIRYMVEILGYSNSINISKGENRFFYFVIKNNNTGAIDDVDSYSITATSKNHWPLIPQETIRNLGIGASTDADDAKVLIEVPKNTTESADVITITVTSDTNQDISATISITVNVMGGGFFEEIYTFFNSVAESLGLNDMFGSEGGAIVLVSILTVIILFLFIILAFVFTTKPVKIICIDRIKEIEATEAARFELTLKNPLRKTQSYEIGVEQTGPSSKWIITLEPTATTIEGRQSKAVQVTVTPTENTISKDWTQVTVYAKKTRKKKKESVALLTMIKEGKTLLQLHNISHWPTVFTPGEKVTTFCSISNNGTVAARNVKVFFYLNGKQKNMVEVTIPAGSIADIQMPWLAEKGKNQVRIRLKEQQ